MTTTTQIPKVEAEPRGAGGEPRMASRLARSTAFQALYWIVLAALLCIFLYPFAWLLSASFKTRANVFDNRLFPNPATVANYAEIWHVAPLLTWLGNSAWIGVLAAATVTLSSAAVAFGFAYFRFRAKNVMFGLVPPRM